MLIQLFAGCPGFLNNALAYLSPGTAPSTLIRTLFLAIIIEITDCNPVSLLNYLIPEERATSTKYWPSWFPKRTFGTRAA